VARSILITGGSGYVGTFLRARLEAEGWDNIRVLAADITAPDLHVPRADVVIHLAGKLNSFRGPASEVERHNFDGTMNLVSRCAPRTHVVFLSTDQVFGSDPDRVYTEADPVGPETVYGRSKVRAEQFLLATTTPRVTILRTAGVYGYRHPRRQNTIEFIASKLRAGAPIELYSDVFTSPTFIGDLCTCIEVAVDEGIYGVHHACGNEYLSRCDIAAAICRAQGFSSELIRPVARPEDANVPRFIHLRPSPVFASALSTPLEEGLRAGTLERVSEGLHLEGVGQ
jgi:dTDP-4-dehydrorhamnose reductase